MKSAMALGVGEVEKAHIPMKGWKALNDRHRGRDVYIFGSAPQLASLTEQQLERLRDVVTLGGNRTYYKTPLTYLLSAYPQEIMIASRHVDESRLIHIKKPHQPPLNDQIITVSRRLYCDGLGLSRYLSEPVPVLYTRRNQVLAMLHLAIVMGARRVIFIGVDQSSYAYFWQYDEVVRERMRTDYRALLADPPAVAGFQPYLEQSLRMVDQSAQEREVMPFYEDFAPILADYIRQARAFGVDVVATLPGSVVHRAGASLSTVDACLTGSAPRRASAVPSRVERPASLVHGLTSRLRPPPPPPPRFAAGYEPPLLVSGLDDGRALLSKALSDAGMRIGSTDAWRDPATSAMAAFGAACAQLKHYKPAWDFPEAAVEAFETRDDIALQATAAVRRAFLAPDLALDLLAGRVTEGPAPTLWTMQQPWGWESRFDVALLQALDFIFPGMRFVHVRSNPDRAADASLFDPITPRCSQPTGALSLAQAYERIAVAAAGRFGSARALLLDADQVRNRPDAAVAQVRRLFGDWRRPPFSPAPN